MIKILGICSSPVKDSNTEKILEQALDSIQADDVHTELITLHDKTIQDCIQCNWCLLKQKEEKFCAMEDHMAELYPKIIAADGLLLATPVYLARLSGHMAVMLDRMRALDYGRQTSGCLKHKVGAGIAVSWYRNSGIETTLAGLHWAFLTWQMIIASPGSMSTFGGAGLSSPGGTGKFDPEKRHHILEDEYGLDTARATAASMVELVNIVKRGDA
ncbi:MAG: flavodoxin family protein [Desulfobacterales bacterium]|nr:flavodoxin family protein [Desulfobacterales bacterium]